MGKLKGIIFDMDNTILRSKIDFQSMKTAIYYYLVMQKVLPEGYNLDHHTTATIIEAAKTSGSLTSETAAVMWNLAERYEKAGMEDAELEPGAKLLLTDLHRSYKLAIVTNNSESAAYAALERHAIASYFDCVVCREQMQSIKPAPDGYLYVLNRWTGISPQEILSVGDAWVDGKGSADAGIPFVAYQGDRQKMEWAGVVPIAEMDELSELKRIINTIN